VKDIFNVNFKPKNRDCEETINVDELNEFYVNWSFGGKCQPFNTLLKEEALKPDNPELFQVENVTDKEVLSAWKKTKKRQSTAEQDGISKKMFSLLLMF